VEISTASTFLDRFRAASHHLIWEVTNDMEYSIHNGLVFHNDLLVPPTKELRLEIITHCHDAPLAGHFGSAKTIELVSRNYWWPGLRCMVKRYIAGCDACLHAKTSRHQPYGLLHPLEVPDAPWTHISLDFITDLPLTQDLDSIFVVKDRFSKMAHFLPCSKAIDAPQTADLFIKEIFCLHGFPKSIVSDRGPQFVSHFWRHLLSHLGVSVNLSSAHHPQTDGSTEIVNQLLEQYLRTYCSYHQDDWLSLLPLAEFAYNNSTNAQSATTPFFACSGTHPVFDPLLEPAPPSFAPAAVDRAQAFLDRSSEIKAQLTQAQECYAHFANQHRLPTPPLSVGDLVFLDRRHIKTTRPCLKLDAKKLGPFKISQIINPVAFGLKLLCTMRIHDVFHVSLLTPKSPAPIHPVTPPPPPVLVDDEQEWEVATILDSKPRGRGVIYLIDWVGYGPEECLWLPLTNLRHAMDHVHAFHQTHPTKPRSPSYTQSL
jgi:hypothetical protein